MTFHVGTSGFHYNHWRERFYPKGLPASRWLQFYATRFTTVELNNPFSRLPSEQTFAGWRERAPEGFTYAVKASRYLTHVKRLADPEEPIERLFSRVQALGPKLGPLLYQLPPGYHAHLDALERFLAALPRGYRHAIEFRHASWHDESVYALLRRFDVAFCVIDMPRFACPLVATASFSYVRFHGRASRYAGFYTDEELSEWAERIRDLTARSGDAYVYFNNDAEANAVYNALTLREMLGGEKPTGSPSA